MDANDVTHVGPATSRWGAEYHRYVTPGALLPPSYAQDLAEQGGEVVDDGHSGHDLDMASLAAFGLAAATEDPVFDGSALSFRVHRGVVAAMERLCAAEYLLQGLVAIQAVEPALEVALVLRSVQLQLFGPESASALTTQDTLAQIQAKSNNHEEAIRLMEDALATRRNIIGRGDRVCANQDENMALTISNLGGAYVKAGDLEKGDALLSEGLELRKKLHGLNHFDTLFSLANLGTVRLRRGFFISAAALLEQALTGRIQLLGAAHPLTVQCAKGFEQAMPLSLRRKSGEGFRGGTTVLEPVFGSGTHIMVVGLQGAPELNGQCGTIQYFDDMKGRYHVYLENRERPVGLRPANCKTLETDDAAGKVQPIGPSE